MERSKWTQLSSIVCFSTFSKMDCLEGKLNWTCVWRVLFEENNIKPCSFYSVVRYRCKISIITNFFEIEYFSIYLIPRRHCVGYRFFVSVILYYASQTLLFLRTLVVLMDFINFFFYFISFLILINIYLSFVSEIFYLKISFPKKKFNKIYI